MGPAFRLDDNSQVSTRPQNPWVRPKDLDSVVKFTGCHYIISRRPDKTIRPDPSVTGYLDVRREKRADGVPFIARQDFRAPVHLSKPHLDQGQWALSLINPTAGRFDAWGLLITKKRGRVSGPAG